MKKVEIFLQGSGIAGIQTVTVEQKMPVHQLMAILGIQDDLQKEMQIFLENVELPIKAGMLFEELKTLEERPNDETDETPPRLHMNKCHAVGVAIRFNGRSLDHRFAPGVTIARVHDWAAKAFGLSRRDAAEHVLQLQNSSEQPDSDIHIGTLAAEGTCSIAFDLVPRKRVEG